jgi:hypothetical protein
VTSVFFSEGGSVHNLREGNQALISWPRLEFMVMRVNVYGSMLLQPPVSVYSFWRYACS